MLYKNSVTALTMRRQCFGANIDRAAYNDLFRLMSPVLTPFWCRPGSPPGLVFRAGFDEYSHVYDMRSRRIIVKGRFQGGGIAYVFSDELPLFAAVYSKDRRRLSYREVELLEMLEREGPLNIGMIKDITGWLAKEITPALHKLQQKFLVFEDQADNEWDRAWYLFETEFPDTDLDEYTKTEAMKTIITRFTHGNVFISVDMLRSYYRLPAAEIEAAVSGLLEENTLSGITIEGGTGYVLSEDIPLLETGQTPPESVYVLHRNDFLVKSNEYRLKEQFHHDILTVLQYILLDGVFKGFVAGYIKNGPFVIEDIVLDMDRAEAGKRRREIIEAVGLVNDPELSPVKRYCGERLVR